MRLLPPWHIAPVTNSVLPTHLQFQDHCHARHNSSTDSLTSFCSLYQSHEALINKAMLRGPFMQLVCQTQPTKVKVAGTFHLPSSKNSKQMSMSGQHDGACRYSGRLCRTNKDESHDQKHRFVYDESLGSSVKNGDRQTMLCHTNDRLARNARRLCTLCPFRVDPRR